MGRELRDLETKARGMRGGGPRGGLISGGTNRTANRITRAANLGALSMGFGLFPGSARAQKRQAKLERVSRYAESRAGGIYNFSKPGGWRRGMRSQAHGKYF